MRKIVLSLLATFVALGSWTAFAQTGEFLTLIPQGAIWRFRDNGVNLGTAWRQPIYSAESTWASGPAQLGFGDGDEATTVNGGPSTSRYITIYFRHSFVLDDPGAITNLTVSLLRDDGGVVYLNGTEVFRSNMPALPTTINYGSLALNAVPSADETVNFYSQGVSPNLLVPGTNVVAVEIHQQGPTSSDLSFDLRLEGIRAPSVGPPVIAAQPQGRSVLLGSNTTFRVTAAGAAPLRYQWSLNQTNISGATNSTLVLSRVTLNDMGQYRVLVTNDLGSVFSSPATLTVLDLDSGIREDVEPEIDPFFWSQFSGTVLGVNYGGSVSGVNSLWFGGDGERFAVTQPLNTTGGSAVEFYIRMADNFSSNWEMPDLPDEGMVFEYSTDNINWVILGDYTAVLLTNWTAQFFELPVAAQSPQTRLRWRQLNNSGSCCDNWAIDDITIASPPSPPRIYGQPTDQVAGEGFGASFKVGVSGVHPLYYQWRFNEMDLPGETNATLVLTNLPLSSAGQYSVFISNSLGSVVSSNATLSVETLGEEFRILSLSTNGAFAVDHYERTGSERGGMALGGEHLLYGSEFGVSGFDPESLVMDTTVSGFTGFLANDLQSGQPYALGNGASLLTSLSGVQTLSTLHEINPASGRLTGRRVSLTTAIPMTNAFSRLGIFSGWGRIVIYSGTRAYNISPRSGLVTDLGSMPTFPSHRTASGLGGFWGVAEYFSNAIHVVYGRDSFNIARTRIPDGTTSNVLSGFLVGSIAQLTVSPRLNRWYFDHQSSSVFLSGVQVLGYANASFAYTPSVRAPVISGQPVDQAGAFGAMVTFRVGVNGSFPLQYQWQFNGDDLPDATNSTLTIGPLAPEVTGAYSVRVSNASGLVQSSNALLTLLAIPPDKFQITRLSTNNPYIVDHEPLTGDNRGGLVLSSNRVFYSGDNSTARFDIGDLGNGTALNTVFDALVSDLQTERVYSLANGTNLLFATSSSNHVTHLMQHDPDTGLLTGNRLALSAPIPLPGNYGNIGLFSGYGRIVVHDGTNVFHIAMPSGQVSYVGKLPPLLHTLSESWAYWGVAEFFDSGLHLVYARNFNTIARTRVSDGFTTTLNRFDSLGGGMASFSVSPNNGRWYFHFYGTSQFGAGNESIGFADAIFKYSAPPLAPRVLVQPLSQTAAIGSTVRLRVSASGTAPLQYQWFVNETEIVGATGPTLVLSNISTADKGVYAVVIVNELGTVVSSNAALNVVPLPGETFRVSTLTATNAYAIETRDLSGFDRGGLGVSGSRVFYNGTVATPGYGVDDLSAGALSPNRGDALVSDLRTEILYSLGNGLTPLPYRGGMVNSLIQLDSYTGETTTNVIALSASINLSGSSGNIGIFAGFGRIALHDGVRVYDIRLPSGEVTELGVMAVPGHMRTGGWAYWGIAEYYDGLVSLVLVQDSTTIVRVRVPDGAVTTIQKFSFLGNMNCISAGAYRNRWFFHHESSSQFSSSFTETLGFADATFEFNDPPLPPSFVPELADKQVIGGRPFSLSIAPTGKHPFSYQWQFNGVDLPGATNASLVFPETTPALSGGYRVVVSNEFGIVPSRTATVTVRDLFALSRNFAIGNLGTNNARVVDHDSVTGDDRGGIAVSSSAVFYTGDTSTGRYLAGDLSSGAAVNRVYDALVSNLRTETVYSLADNANILNSGGGVATRLIQLDGLSGALTTTIIRLSSPIVLSNIYYGSIGFFSGYDRIVIYNGERVYSIELPDGTVFDHGVMVSPSHTTCENWAYWGVAEQGDNAISLVYVRSSTSIARTRVPDGTTAIIASYNLQDMCSFTVSPTRNRWYFHYEGSAQFGGSSETLGYADASFYSPASILGLYNRTILEDSVLGPIPFQILDATVQSNIVSVAAISSNTNLVASSNIVISGSGTNWTLTALPFAQSNGVSTITVAVQVGTRPPILHPFTLAVTPVNDPPAFTVPTNIVVLEDAGGQFLSGWITNMSVGPANESSGNSQSLTVSITNDNPALFSSQPILYVYTFSRFSDFYYIPAPNAFGTARVTFRVQDGGGTFNGGSDTTTQTVTITILPVNDAPTFTLGFSVDVLEDVGPQFVPGWATGISAGPNETNQALAFSLTAADPSLFAVQPAMDVAGNLSFTPATNANGSTSVRVTLQDDGGTNNFGVDTRIRIFSLRIASVNDPPTAAKGADPVVLEDSGVQIFSNWVASISAGPADEVDQSVAMEFSVDSTNLFSVPPVLSEDGTLSFTAASNAFGVVNGTIRLQDTGGTADGGADTTLIPFTITLAPVNDAPSFIPGPDQTLAADAGPQVFPNWATSISAGPENEAAQTLTFVLSNSNPRLFASQPAVSSNGTLTFTPAINGNGAAEVFVTLQDSGGTTNAGVDVSATALCRITVTPVPHPPYANSQAVSLNEDTPTAITLGAGDIDGDTLSYTITSPLHGTLSGVPPNLVYTPSANYFGPDSFNFKVGDGSFESSWASVTITVRSVNDGPLAVARASGPTQLGTNQTNSVFLAPDNLQAMVIFDGSQSSDIESNAFQSFWYEQGATNAFAAGVRATNMVEVGTYTIVLYAWDGSGGGADTIHVQVMTPDEAVGRIMAFLDEAEMNRNSRQSFIASLKAAAKSFSKGNLRPAINELLALQNKLKAQLQPEDAAVAAQLHSRVQEIIDALDDYAAPGRVK